VPQAAWAMPPTLAPPTLAQWNHVFTMLETEPKGTLRAAHKWLLEPEQGHTTAAEAPAPAARFEAADLASSVQHTTGPPVHVEPVSAATTEGHTEPTPAPCRACLDLLRGVRTTAHFAVADDLPDDRCHPRGGSGLPQLCLQGLLQSTGWVRSASPSRFGAATLCANATEPSHALGRTGVAIAARGGTRAGCVRWATAYVFGVCACRFSLRP
jgi:hypothetical protein